jgi:succinate dehydrogenase/fumarate reductase flavoprotein subunit
MADFRIHDIKTDVLVVGGGLAGCMAAIKAAENEDLSVTIVEKSDTRASGKAGTGIDHTWAYMPPVHEKMGYTLDDMLEDYRCTVAGRDPAFFRDDLWYEVAGSIYDRVMDLERFGVTIRYQDSVVPGKYRVVYQYHSVPSSFNYDGVSLKPCLTAEAKRRKVKIVNRVQVTDLLKSADQISGAIGVATRGRDIYLFQAKAVVLCTGGRGARIHRNPTGVDFNTYTPPGCTADGLAMAFRLGLPVIGAETLGGSLHLRAGANYNPNYGDPGNTVQPAARIINWKGEVIVPRSEFYDWKRLGAEKWNAGVRRQWLKEREISNMAVRGKLAEGHARGEGPFYLDFSEASEDEARYIVWSIKNEGRGTQFMRYFEGEEGFDLKHTRQEYAGFGTLETSIGKGLWVSQGFETATRNLFAAGDDVGGFVVGLASAGAFAGGWIAGDGAGKRAKGQKEFLDLDRDCIEARMNMAMQVADRPRGFYWKEVETYVQNLMDFYCGRMRSASMLERGLERLDYARKAPLKAENPHELARTLELQCIMDNAEMVMRASLARKESRPAPFGFYRADYPEKDDAQWKCFLGVQKDDGQFHFPKFTGPRSAGN